MDKKDTRQLIEALEGIKENLLIIAIVLGIITGVFISAFVVL